MTSTLGINDYQPRNLEAPRSTDLLPDQIRVTTTNFMMLLTEYYKFMNVNEWATVVLTSSTTTILSNGLLSTSVSTISTSTVLSGKSGSGPSNIIYSILSQLDVDQVDQDYLSHIQNAVAPYVPIPSYMSTTSAATTGNSAPFYNHLSNEERAFLRAQLYRKIIKFFYNTRGSRNSAVSFFQLFYNDTASTYDANDYLGTVQNYIQNWLTTSGMPISVTTVSAGSTVYGQTPIQAWTPFSYVITTGVIGGDNTFKVPYRALVHPVGFKYFIQPTGSNNGIIEISPSRMVNARYDYQNALWFLDPTEITEYANYTVGDASGNYNEANQNTSTYTYADWSNVGAVNKFTATLSSSFVSGTNTLSISTTSSLNIVPGMFVSAPGAIFFTGVNTTSTTSAITISSSSTSTGIITLNGSLSSSTLAPNTIITFSP